MERKQDLFNAISNLDEEDLAYIKEQITIIESKRRSDKKLKCESEQKLNERYQESSCIEQSIPPQLDQNLNQDKDSSIVESAIASQISKNIQNNQKISQTITKQKNQNSDDSTHALITSNIAKYETKTQDDSNSFEYQGQEENLHQKNTENYFKQPINYLQEPSHIKSNISSQLTHNLIAESPIPSQLSQKFDNNYEVSQTSNKKILKTSNDSNHVSIKTQVDQNSFEFQEEEKYEEQNEDILNSYEIDFKEQEKKYQEKLDDLYQKNKKHNYLILGDTGTGKSSFIKKITENPEIQTSKSKDSHTQSCQMFTKDDKIYIDTPGMNDTKQNRYKIIFNTVKYIRSQNLILDDLFILIVQNKDLKSLTILREFSYIYFLYELFGDDIELQDLQKLVEEYNISSYLLNWSEVGLHDIEDHLQDKRKIVFKEKSKASNYFEYIYSYHIRILTFFDKKSFAVLQQFDDYQTEFLKEQIWSEHNQQTRFYEYNDYIKDQKNHLLKKIEEIMRLEIKNKSKDFNQDYQNILLIGESQVGKSSLIEQLINQKGLRGCGSQSQTPVCSTYQVYYENVVYRFIDTPGYKGSENNQNSYHNFKIIADYLLRNEIKDFKLLFMINKGIEVRETIYNELSEFFQFIAYIFDQDVSFLDRQYLEDLQQNKQNIYMTKILLRDKILQIFRIDNDYDEYQFDDEFLQYTLFKSNFRTKYGKLIQVLQEEDYKQKKLLFQKINNIDSFTLDDKAAFRIQKSLLENIISSYDQFNNQFNKIAQKYYQKSQLETQVQQINNSNCQKNTNQLAQINKEKQKIIKELKNMQFNVLKNVYNYMSDIIQTSEFSDKINNDTLRHFLPIQQNSILFEITDENPESILISRKQHYYSLLVHQLSQFIDINNQKHTKKLENIAEINLSQEICFQQIEQSKSIENNYLNSPVENIQKIQQLSDILNLIKHKGIQIYKQYSYINQTIQHLDLGNFKDFSQLKQAAKILFAPSIVGYSVSQFFGGAIPIVAAIITLKLIFDYFFENNFDSNVAIYFEKILNENLPNQQLNYYEVAQLIKNKFKINNFSQLEDKITKKKIHIKLNKNKFDRNQKILVQLFKPNQIQNLQDMITNFITENYIISDIKHNKEFQQQNDEKNINYLESCIQKLQNIESMIQNFYNQLPEYKNMCKNAIDLMKNKLKSEKLKEKQNQCSEKVKVEFQLNEMKILENYQEKLDQLKQYSSEITYESIQNQENYQKLFNIYGNLTYLKIKQKLKQPLISEIKVDIPNMKFKIEQTKQFKEESIIFKSTKDQLTDLLHTQSMINKYIENRYLQQIQENDKPNLTSLAKDETIQFEISYSIDLHDLAINSNEEKDFIQKVQAKLRQNLVKLFKINQENDDLKLNILRSKVEEKVKILNTCEINFRIRSFYKSVQFLKEYFKI